MVLRILIWVVAVAAFTCPLVLIANSIVLLWATTTRDPPHVHHWPSGNPAVEIVPYERKDGSIVYAITSVRWDFDIDSQRVYHGDTIWWTMGPPTIKLVKYHPPKMTAITKVTGDIP